MNILDTFFETIEWDEVDCDRNLPRPFIEDMSVSARSKHSYAMQMMNDLLTDVPRYSVQDLHAESLFLKSLQDNKVSYCFSNGGITPDNLNEPSNDRRLRPGEIHSFINYPKMSTFSIADLKKYKGILYKIKKHIHITPAEVETFQDLDKRLKEERKEYQEFARKQWITKNYLRHGTILPDVKRYIDEVWQVRINRLNKYPALYKQLIMVPLVYNIGADSESNEIDMVPGRVLHKEGKPGQYAFLPNNQQKFLCTNYSDLIQQCTPDDSPKYPPVSCDPVAEKLVKKSEANVVISSSGLKCLLDNQSTNLMAAWSLPIIVKEYKQDCGTKRVIFIDKKLPPKTMSYSQRLYWHTKIATRLLYCQRKEDVAYDNISVIEPSTIMEDSNCFASTESVDPSLNGMDCHDLKQNSDFIGDDMSDKTDVSDNENLIIDMDCEESNNLEGQQHAYISDMSKKNSGIVNQESLSAESPSAKNDNPSSSLHLDPSDKGRSEDNNKNNIRCNKCYIYQMWQLGKQNINQLMKSDGGNEVISIILRSRCDCTYENYARRNMKKKMQSLVENGVVNIDDQGLTAVNDFKNVVHLVPKLEYQFDLGAERTTASECIRLWADVVIRPGCEIYQVRINPLTEEVIQTERLNQHRINIDGLSKNIHFSKVWCSLYSVLSKLITLAPGNYLLEHSPKHGAFSPLSVAVDRPGPGTSNLYNSYNVSVDEVAPIQAPWIPLDETVYTPMCRYKYVLPLMFPISRKINPSKPKCIIGKANNIKKKKKKKNKRNKKIKTIKDL